MKHWYVVYTKPWQEKVAEENLIAQSYDICLPLIKEPKRIRRQWHDQINPLFPRYLFIKLRLGADDIGPISSTRGVIKLVKFGDGPTPLPTGFVEELVQKSEPKSGCHLPQRPLFKQGDLIKVLEGPFTGNTGTYQIKTGEQRVLVLMDILGGRRNITFNHNQISPVMS